MLHDGAPNVGTAWLQDAYSQAVLVLMALKLATEFLMPGGTFITKVFRSKDYNKLLWVFNQLFTKVEATKPPASRNVSAEIFVVCRGYKAPQKLDSKFLDPRSVFEELPDPAPNAEAKVFHPEKRKRQREGYEDGDYTFYHERTATEFIEAQDPLQLLSSTSRLTWSDEASRKLRFKEFTTKEIIACSEDLKVLGKKEFRNLLRWRLQIREELGLSAKTDEVEEKPTETVTITEDDQIEAEMERLTAQDTATKKRERRRLNERKRKEILRMQMGMLTPHELGLEQDVMASDQIFALKQAEKNGAMKELLNGTVPEESEEEEEEEDVGEKEEEDEIDDLEAELDNMYNKFQEQKAERDAKYRAKRAREEVDEWDGLDDTNGVPNGKEGSDSDSDSELESLPDEDNPVDSLLTSLGPRLDARSNGQLSQRAALFFDQPEFEGIETDEVETPKIKDNGIHEPVDKPTIDQRNVEEQEAPSEDEEDNISDDEFEVVPQELEDEDPWEEESDSGKVDKKQGILFVTCYLTIDIDIVTAEAMTLAHQLATRQKTKASMIDDSYNRWTFSDKSALPSWFADDESKHNKPQIPITKEAAEAIKAKLRALNARPIKKVMEAKARKKMKVVRRLNKLQKKADVINETSDMTEREKAQSISKLMSKAKKGEKKRTVQVVVAHGRNKAIRGRPGGVKGRYKMVDPRMKKEKRALKRAGKKLA